VGKSKARKRLTPEQEIMSIDRRKPLSWEEIRDIQRRISALVTKR